MRRCPRREGSRTPTSRTRSRATSRPIMTPADRMRTRENWRQAVYNKPAVGLVLLREHITSPERFDPVFREYIRRWAFKHPTPADFFRTMEDGLGEDLSWFWRSWFYTTDRLDQAVDSVSLADSAGVVSRIYLRNAGLMPMPVELGLLMDDGKHAAAAPAGGDLGPARPVHGPDSGPEEGERRGDRSGRMVPGRGPLEQPVARGRPGAPARRREPGSALAARRAATARSACRSRRAIRWRAAHPRYRCRRRRPAGSGRSAGSTGRPRACPTRRAPPRRRCSRPCRGSAGTRPSRSCGSRPPRRWKNATSRGWVRSETSTTWMSPLDWAPNNCGPLLPDEQVPALTQHRIVEPPPVVHRGPARHAVGSGHQPAHFHGRRRAGRCGRRCPHRR